MARRQASAASSARWAGAGVVVDEAVVGALVAHDRDAGGLGRLDVGGRCPLVDGADDRHRRAGAVGGDGVERLDACRSPFQCSGTRSIP